MAHLYELTNEFNELLSLLEQGEELETETDYLWDTIESVELDLRAKAVNIACLVKSLNADVEAFKQEEQALAKRRKTIEKHVQTLKDYATRQLQLAGVTEIKTDPRAQITFRKTKSIEVAPEFIEWAQDNHRDDLLNYTVSASKTAIKNALKAGGEIPFATEVETMNIQIK